MPDPIMTSFQTFTHYATCGCVPKPVRHSANPPVDQQQLEAGHESASSTRVSPGAIQETPGGQRMRSSLSSEIGRATTQADREAIKSALSALDTSIETVQGASSAAGRASPAPEAALEKLNKMLQAAVSDPDRFNSVSHYLLHELMDAPPHVQRQVGEKVLAAFKDRLTSLAKIATKAILYAPNVHERYHPKEGLPHQYGWDVSPVKHGVYDVMIAARRSQGALSHPLYRMPRLDQMAAEMARQAHDPEAPAHGFAISRMAGFFHQVAYYFHIDRSGEKPTIHIMPVDSETRGKEIVLQLGECLKGSGCKVNIHAINGGTQFSPAGCPMFSPFNVDILNANPEALNALLQKMKQQLPLHEEALFSHKAGPDISMAVYNGEHFLSPEFYDICQSNTTLTRIAERVQTPAKTVMRDVIDNAGKQRRANFLLEQTHAERTTVMLDYLKVLLTMKPAEGDAMLNAHLHEVRQSSWGDDDDLKMDRPCAAAQLADQIGEPVVWLDISSLANDEGRWQDLMSELDRSDRPGLMKLGYLQKQGFPVFSDWHVEDGKTYLKDDRYFHVFGRGPDAPKEMEMRPSDYMQTDSGLRAGATYNFVAFPKSAFESDRPAFAGLDVNEVKPRITATGE